MFLMSTRWSWTEYECVTVNEVKIIGETVKNVFRHEVFHSLLGAPALPSKDRLDITVKIYSLRPSAPSGR